MGVSASFNSTAWWTVDNTDNAWQSAGGYNSTTGFSDGPNGMNVTYNYATRQLLSHFELSRSSVDNVIRFYLQASNDPNVFNTILQSLSRTPPPRVWYGSAQPVDGATFKLVMADINGPVRVIDTPAVEWDYNITLSKDGRVANTGLYRLSLGPGLGAPGLVTKLS
ncbi:hypothetical protein T492DRAFT_835880 [Pavlovales sp. CCMP2436]|nr:hypothetical protein T492DRAFT_835880 [Pavlovales sp. CCMP2436]